MEKKKLTGYPSVDKPWTKYYSEEAVKATLPATSIYDYLWDENKDRLTDIALIYFGRKISYKRMFEYIASTAQAFSQIGVKEGDIVAVALPNLPEYVYCLYGLNKMGAISDMIDLRSKGDILCHYFIESKAKVAVICDLFAQNTFDILDKTDIETVIIVSPYESLSAPFRLVMKAKADKITLPKGALLWSNFVKGKGKNNFPKVDANATASIFHTSGTTGTPKGVMLSNLAFNAMVINIVGSGLRCVPGEVMMNQVPPFLAYNALCTTHMSLSLHFKMIMLPEYNPDKFAENIVKLKPNYAVAGPADWRNFLACPRTKDHTADLSYLLSLISGSDSLPQKDKDAVNRLLHDSGCTVRIQEGYGMTEIGAGACANVPQRNIDGSLGIPLPLNNFCIYDNKAGKELPYNEIGEICMTGPTVIKGYFNNPEETEHVLKRHTDGFLWLHSGDLGYISEDGNVYLEGRLKRVIVLHNGFKVFPFGLEKTILKHKNVLACCVVGRFDKEHQMGQVPVAFIVQKERNNITVNEIKEICKREQSEKNQPNGIIVLDSLPLTPNGKVDYRALEAMAAQV